MAIRQMRAIEVPETPGDCVFRASRQYAALFALACIAGCAGMIFFDWPRPRLAYYSSGVIIFFLLASHRFLSARFRVSNWLVRMNEEGLFIHFRSYLNDHLSADDPTVVFLPYQDIRSARLVRERVKTRDADGAIETRFRRCAELELAINAASLAAALATESARPARWEKRWYGQSTTLYRDYPVQVQPPFLRIEWRVVPGVSHFLDALRQHVAIAPSVVIAENFADLERLPRDQQEKRLRDLDQRGNTIAAVHMARKLYGLSLAEATHFVKNLSGESQP
jgi:hypothetical protein